MIKNIILVLLLMISISFGDDLSYLQTDKTMSTTIGLLNGGGSLIGVDVEKMISKKVGIQVGAGIVGSSIALNYHPKGHVLSSAYSLAYWNQRGFNDFSIQYVGITRIFKNKSKGLTYQLGLGYLLPMDASAEEEFKRLLDVEEIPVVAALYSIGFMF